MGTSVTVAGSGMVASSSIAIKFANISPIVTCTSDSNGSFSCSVKVPNSTAAGFTVAGGTTYSFRATESSSPTHTYAAAGTYTATLTATDKDGGVSSASSATVSVSTGSSGSSQPFPNNANPPGMACTIWSLLFGL